ncbi:MAG: zinc-binding dehydrogenase [Opitutales bacterium]|nr:zinc-binding dehydrogenase [Opitutales bacterium]
MKFKAAILVESKKDLVVDEISSRPLEAGQVLVKINCSGICGAQINEIDAVKGPDNFLPHLLGHEGGGIVQEIGAGVTRLKPGDRVVMHWRKASGIHAQPAKYNWNGKTVNAGWVTTFSEYSVVSENRLTVVPETTSFEVCALMGCALTTAFGIINNDASVNIGESVVVFGCGGIGLPEIQAAKIAGAYPVIGVDVSEQKLQWAKDFGADEVVLSSDTVLDDIRAHLGDRFADVVIENTGIVKVIQSAYELGRDRTGRIILAGVPNASEKTPIYTLPLHFGKVLKGSEGGSTIPDLDIPRLLKVSTARKYDFEALISHRFTLDSINEGLNLLRNGNCKRVLLDM